MADIVVDAHQHFWTYGTYQTSWMEQPPYAGDPAFEPIRRSFSPKDLLVELEATNVHASIVVEAADHDAENAALAAFARHHEHVAGLVGWVPLEQPEKAARMLEALSKNKKFVGIRHLVNVEPDPSWILRPAVVEGLKSVAKHGLAFDFVGILPQHLENVALLAAKLPELRIIIDHLGKPPISSGHLGPWRSLLKAAAEFPNMFAKLSGLDVQKPDWTAVDIAPSIEHALTVFGPDRLMFGSDWPVANLRGGYAKVWRETNAALSCLSSIDKGKVLGGTAIKVYKLQF